MNATSVARLIKATTLAAAMVGSTAAATLSSATSALAIGLPDLSVSLSASPNPVHAYAMVTYTLQVSNTALEQCRPGSNGDACYPVGRPVNNVVAQLTLPAGSGYSSGSGDHGFVCPLPPLGGNTVVCTGGSLAMDDTATIVIHATAPGNAPTVTATATVDPFGSIGERSESNNSASVSLTIIPPPLPDLTGAVMTAPDQSIGFTPGSQATYIASIQNIYGQAAAPSPSIRLAVGTNQWTFVSASANNVPVTCATIPDPAKLVVQCQLGADVQAGTYNSYIAVVVRIPANEPGQSWNDSETVDPNNLIWESNETNNTYQFTTHRAFLS